MFGGNYDVTARCFLAGWVALERQQKEAARARSVLRYDPKTNAKHRNMMRGLITGAVAMDILSTLPPPPRRKH